VKGYRLEIETAFRNKLASFYLKRCGLSEMVSGESHKLMRKPRGFDSHTRYKKFFEKVGLRTDKQ
jgi:hypothetical protein